MKKVILAVSLAFAALGAQAATYWVNGVQYGNVCRSGPYYTVYFNESRPVGSVCAVRAPNGGFIGWGIVTDE